MTVLRGAQIAARAAQRRQEVRRELDRVGAAEKEHAARRAQVREAVASAWQNLLEVLLPGLDAAALDAAARRIGLPALAASEVARRRQARQQLLASAVAGFDADPLVAQHEGRLNAIDIRLAELEDSIRPLGASVERLRGDAEFTTLLRRRYGGDGYVGHWWQWSYYRDWKLGDAVVERYRADYGVTDFAELSRKHLQEAEALQTLVGERASQQQQQREIEKRVQQRDEAARGLATLDDWTLGTARALAREHLAALDDAERVKLLGGDGALELAAKRVSGAEAKDRYLEAIGDEWLRKSREEAERLADKLERAVEKFRRPKNAGLDMSADEFDARYGLGPRWNERWQRYDHTCHSIVLFDDYYRYDPVADYLWWDLMTGGNVRASFIPEVSEYHAQHHHHDATAAVAAGDGSSPDRMVDAS